MSIERTYGPHYPYTPIAKLHDPRGYEDMAVTLNDWATDTRPELAAYYRERARFYRAMAVGKMMSEA